jgi:A/G-specific adenine glycosylase
MDEIPHTPAWQAALHERLLRWYDQQARDLPWRQTNDPYAIWISEIMLQQTQVARVTEYFARWMARFPTVAALAAAPLDDVLHLWQGLGYYARARNLHRAAQQVVAEHGGALPADRDLLLGLPGIGRYTAGAIASIAFGAATAALDGNLKRVFARLAGVGIPINTSEGERALWDIAEALVPPERAGDWNQALMDLGATICIPQTPRCLLCPLVGLCLAQAEGQQTVLPLKQAAKARPHHEAAAGLIWNEAGELLIAQRPLNVLLGGLWGFPGGQCLPDEPPDACLQRQVAADFGLTIEVGPPLTVVEHGYTHFTTRIHAFHCQHRGGAPEPRQAIAWRWASPATLDTFAWPRTDQQMIEALRAAAR